MTNPKSKSYVHRWNTLRLENNAAARWSSETFALYVQRVSDDWIMALGSEAEASLPGLNIERVQSLPLGLDWKRWALGPNDNEIRFWPAFPDRPLVIKTRAPVIIPIESSVSFSIGLPLWLEVSVARGDSFLELDRFGSQKLSSTWYGDHFDGELCYSLGSRARRTTESPDAGTAFHLEPLRALCHLSIENDSDEPLLLEKIRLHTNRLAIYSHKDQLHCNCVHVTFHGSNVPSTVRYDSAPKLEQGSYQLLKEASALHRNGSFLDNLLFKPFRNH